MEVFIKNSLKPPYKIEINQYVYKSTEDSADISNKKIFQSLNKNY